MRKGYVCSRYPYLRIGDSIQFDGGVYSTDDELKQERIEASLHFLGGRIAVAMEENPFPVVSNAPVQDERPRAVHQAPPSEPILDTPQDQPKSLLPEGYVPLEQQPREGRAAPVDALPVDAPEDGAIPDQRWKAGHMRVAELAALAIGRGLVLPPHPTKAQILDLLYPKGDS